MKKAEIRSRLADIVEFAGIERFLDTPVKRYSSGMYVRLAFAVAAHVEPDILIVDEVLSVGDAEFQKRALGKIDAVRGTGKTVLFVSHNLAAVSSLCSRCIVLKHGGVDFDGDVGAAVARYLNDGGPNASDSVVDLCKHPGRLWRTRPLMTALAVSGCDKIQGKAIVSGGSMVIRLELDVIEPLRSPRIGIGFDTVTGVRLFTVANNYSKDLINDIDGRITVVCRIGVVPLAPGTYSLTIGVGTAQNIAMDVVENAAMIVVEAADVFGSRELPRDDHGPIVVQSQWSIDDVSFRDAAS